MAASLPFGRRPSGSFTPNFPAGPDPRIGTAQIYAPHNSHPYAAQASDLASNYQYTTARAPFDHALAFEGASGSSQPSWFYNASNQTASQALAAAALPYHLESYVQQHASTAAPIDMPGSSIPSMNAAAPHPHNPVQPTTNFPAKLAPIGSTEAVPFSIGPSGSISTASHPLADVLSPSRPDRRASDESIQFASSSGLGSSGTNLPASGSAGFNGSISPNSSVSLSASPQDTNVSRHHQAYTTASVPPLGGMVMGEPISASMMESIDAWLAPAHSAPQSGAPSSSAAPHLLEVAMTTAKAPTASARNISPSGASASASAASDALSSSQISAGATFHPGSSTHASSALDALPFKTSNERRERNKASQRESRKRKQDRLETLETENVALRKALADTKKFSHALSNGAGIRGQDGAEIEPMQLAKFSGAFHLDLVESHLEDDSAEAEWSHMIGRRFPPASSSQASDADDGAVRNASSTSDLDQENRARVERDTSATVQGTAPVKAESSIASSDDAAAESSQAPSQQVKKAMWEISLNQKRNKAAQNFPSMVAVPELVLYRVCRLYFSTLLPFTTKLKSGIINLRAARETPGFMGAFEEMPRFPGDPAFGSSDLYLPKNLMPTEMQMRIGFHPVEVAVLPYPLMRDRLLTVLSAFQALDELAREEDAAGRISEESSHVSPSTDSAQAPQQDVRKDDVNTELTNEDIRHRTALVADMSAWKPSDACSAVVIPDRGRIYSYGYHEKPRGSHRLRKPAQRWLDEFFHELVQSLRVWSPAGDVFDGECFEFKESFFRKYPYLVDGEILKATNRWRRARGENPIRL